MNTMAKTSGLVKSSTAIRELGTRIERARQAYNEKIARADVEFKDAVRRALDATETADEQPAQPPPPSEAAQ